VAFAFNADTSLHVIGMIVAFGARWRYVEFDRPLEGMDGGWGQDI